MDKVSLSKASLEKTTAASSGTDKKAPAKARAAASETKPLVTPDYVVSISAEKTETKSTYSPAEVKAKAKAFLAQGNISAQEKAVLGEILEKSED